MMMRALLIATLLFACGDDRAAAEPQKPAAPQPQKKAAPEPQKQATPMSELKPTAAFRAHAAKALGAQVTEVNGGATDEATAKSGANSVGNAWAYEMWFKDDHTRAVRGWATPDGKVISPDDNLGLLFAEAGAFGKLSDDQLSELSGKLANLIVWSFGMGHRVVKDPMTKGPVLTAKQLTFVDGYKQAGPGGAGGGPETKSKITVELGANHTAKLTKTP